MTTTRKKHVITLAAWAAFQGLFVALHFSWFNLGVLLVGALFLYCTTVCGKRHDNTMVVFTIGHLLGITFAMFIGYRFMSSVLPVILEAENGGSMFMEMLGEGLENFSDGMGRIEGPFFVNILLAIVVTILRKKLGSTRPMFELICRYLTRTLLLFIPLSAWYGEWKIKGLYLIVMAIFLASDAMICKCNDACPKTGRRWFLWGSVLLFVLLVFDPYALDPFLEEGFLEYYLVLNGLRWYVILIELIILVVAMLGVRVGAPMQNPRHSTDFFMYENALCIYVAFVTLMKFRVGYWWVLALIYGICVLYTILCLPPKRTYDRKHEMKSFYFLPGITLYLVGIVISAYFGWLGVALVFGAGLFLVIKVRAKVLDLIEYYSWKEYAGYYTLILCWIATMAGMILWSFRRLPFSFALLVGILAVCVAFIWFFSYTKADFAPDLELVRGSVVIAMLVLCFFLCLRGGSRIKLETNEEGIRVPVVTARGKENEIESVEYYWLSLSNSADEEFEFEESDSPFPKDVQIEPDEIPNASGRLRVVATDENGVVTERSFWFNVNAYEQMLAENAEE